MGVRIDLDVDAGWLVATLKVDGERFAWRASYLSDSFYEWLAATAVALSGRETRVIFVEEPGCINLDLAPLEGGRLRLSFFRHDNWPLNGDPPGAPVATFEVRSRTFAGAVLSSAQALLDQLGEVGFKARWRHEFPVQKLEELRSALRQ